MKTVVVIPTYDEKENVRTMAKAVLDLEPLTLNLELLFVDDNSPDGTGDVIEEMMKTEPRIHCLHREKKEGLGRAYVAGFQKAIELGADLIIQMDCDFSHDPKDIPRLIEAMKDADLVIEAASENINIKKQIFKTLSETCKPETILSSNTSSISIAEIASAVSDPTKVIGMHFFNPAPVMKLLELIPGIKTSEETLAVLRDDVGPKMGKVVITSKDHAGFIVNSLMEPMINEAIYLLDSGVGTKEDIDTGAKVGLNHPMGPLELADLAGLDVVCAVLDVMYNDSKNPKYAPCPLLKRMVSAGLYGRKCGHGFYDYTDK